MTDNSIEKNHRILGKKKIGRLIHFKEETGRETLRGIRQGGGTGCEKIASDKPNHVYKELTITDVQERLRKGGRIKSPRYKTQHSVRRKVKRPFRLELAWYGSGDRRRQRGKGDAHNNYRA